MFSSLWTASLLGLMVAAPVRDEAMTLLARAIKAQGGDEKLAKAQAGTWNFKATAEEGGMKFELSGDVAVQSTDHMRMTVTIKERDENETGVVVINPDKIWSKRGDDKTRELPVDAHFLRDLLRTIRISQNLTALRSSHLNLTYLDERKIDSRPAVGLKITTKDHADIDLFFDKTTSLPLRAEMRVKEPGHANEVVYGFYFAHFAEINGMQHFTSLIVKRDDKPFLNVEFSDFKFHEKLDANQFAQP